MGFTLITRVGRCTRDPRVLAELAQIFLRAVVASNRVVIRERKAMGKPIPRLYDSGVVYEPEPNNGFEEFADLLTVLHRGWGDCDDLCAWLVAELQEQGVNADARLYWRYFDAQGRRVPESVVVRTMPPGVKMMMHCEVRMPDGKIVDPSRFLGL